MNIFKNSANNNNKFLGSKLYNMKPLSYEQEREMMMMLMRLMTRQG